MNKKENIVHQASILIIAGFAVRFLGFLYRIPLTAMLGDEGNAYYSQAYYLYTFFLVMSSAGLPAAISKMVASRNSENKYLESHKIFRVSLAFAAVVGTISMLLLFFGAEEFSNFVGQPGSVYAMKTLAPTVLIVSIMACVRGYFQGMRVTEPTAISQIVEQVFNAIFSVLVAYILIGIGPNIIANMGTPSVEFNQELALVSAGGTSGTGIGAAAGLITILFIYYLNKDRIKRRFSKGDQETEGGLYLLKELIWTAVPIIAGTAVFSMTNIVDMKMVMTRLMASGAFTQEEATVLYGQLSGKYTVLVTLPVSISTAMATASIPNISALITENRKKEAEYKMNSVIKLTMIICIPAAFGLGILADQILYLIYPTYPDGGNLLKIGSISVVFLALTQILTGVLQGTGNVKIPLISALLGVMVKIPVSYVLLAIPVININGAVISTICCYVVASTCNYYFLKRATNTKLRYRAIFAKPIVASICMSIVVLIVYNIGNFIFQGDYLGNFMGVILSIPLGAAAYFYVLIKLRGLNKSEIESIPMGNKISRFIK